MYSPIRIWPARLFARGFLLPYFTINTKERTSFLKKRSKKLFVAVADLIRKSFLVLFSKKNSLACF